MLLAAGWSEEDIRREGWDIDVPTTQPGQPYDLTYTYVIPSVICDLYVILLRAYLTPSAGAVAAAPPDDPEGGENIDDDDEDDHEYHNTARRHWQRTSTPTSSTSRSGGGGGRRLIISDTDRELADLLTSDNNDGNIIDMENIGVTLEGVREVVFGTSASRSGRRGGNGE